MLLAGVLIGVVLTDGVSAAPGPPGPLEVAEQNLDHDGHIKVHEQGVVPVRDLDSLAQGIPFFESASGQSAGNSNNMIVDIELDLPEGKVFILERVFTSVQVLQAVEIQSTDVIFRDAGGSFLGDYPIRTFLKSESGNVRNFIGDDVDIPWRFETGDKITFQASTFGIAIILPGLRVVGHLVDE